MEKVVYFTYTPDVVAAMRFEMAQTVEDVLARRTQVLFLDSAAAIETASKVVELMAAEMGMDEHWITEQLRQFEAVASYFSSFATIDFSAQK